MIIAQAKLKGEAPIQFGAPLQTKKESNEPDRDFEERIWLERAHFTPDGYVFLSPMGFKYCLTDATKYMGSIPGKKNAKYTNRFKAGILCTTPAILEPRMKAEDLKPLWLFVPSTGVAGDGKRVWKKFPTIQGDWHTTLEIIVLDEIITKSVLIEAIDFAGKFGGIGSFRPSRGGYFGRFSLESLEWGNGKK